MNFEKMVTSHFQKIAIDKKKKCNERTPLI